MTVQARRGCGQTRMAGAYTDQRLNLSKLWEGPRKKCQGFKPDPGNPAVRDYRGASGNVSHGGNVHPSCNRKSGKRKPPTYSGARPISIPISSQLHPLLRNRVRSGRPERRSHLLNAEAPQAAIEGRAKATVAIVNQKPRWQSIPRAALHYLLGYPLCRRKWGYRNVQDFPVNVSDYKKDVERLKQDRLDTEEIARPYARFMALQEFSPTRGWPSTVP